MHIHSWLTPHLYEVHSQKLREKDEKALWQHWRVSFMASDRSIFHALDRFFNAERRFQDLGILCSLPG